MLAFPFAFLVTLAFLRVAVVTGGIVVCSSTWSPAILRPMFSSAAVLAHVDVCRARVGRAGRAISFLVLVFAFTLLLTFLEGADLHPVIVCARYWGRVRIGSQALLLPADDKLKFAAGGGVAVQLAVWAMSCG